MNELTVTSDKSVTGEVTKVAITGSIKGRVHPLISVVGISVVVILKLVKGGPVGHLSSGVSAESFDGTAVRHLAIVVSVGKRASSGNSEISRCVEASGRYLVRVPDSVAFIVRRVEFHLDRSNAGVVVIGKNSRDSGSIGLIDAYIF